MSVSCFSTKLTPLGRCPEGAAAGANGSWKPPRSIKSTWHPRGRGEMRCSLPARYQGRTLACAACDAGARRVGREDRRGRCSAGGLCVLSVI
eukprot:274704-Prymnesium_polylepis.2